MPSSDTAALIALNRSYVDAFMNSDSAWYDAHTTPDFECLNSDGSVTTRAAFLEDARQPMSYKQFSLEQVRVKLLGDVALITAITPYVRADGSTGSSRYTDVWVRTGGEWKAAQAQITPILVR